MSENIQAIRGMNDILPDTSYQWQQLENLIQHIVSQYGFSQVRTPVLESTQLFKRGVGEATDIVEKEMYTFEDRNGDSLTLRPEGTASIVRCGIEHGSFYNQTQKWFYLGPMYRHERPQKGRYRQFYQFGIETFGSPGAEADAELILMMTRVWKTLAILPYMRLELNTLGTPEVRQAYTQALKQYFEQHSALLDADSQTRLHRNPLRILDSKNPDMKELIKGAPQMSDFMDEVSTAHFNKLRTILDDNHIAYVLNPHLVRGLDYYTHTVFEWVTDSLGSQGTFCSGGRYDGLVAQLGGHSTPAVGLAIGLDRLLLLLQETGLAAQHFQVKVADYFIIPLSEATVGMAQKIAEEIRDRLPQAVVLVSLGVSGMKSQFKKADKSGAAYAVIVGEEEMKNHTVAVKSLRKEGEQKTLPLAEFLRDLG